MQGQVYEQLTFFPAGSPASRSVLPASAEAARMTVTSGRKCFELSKKSGPVGCLERMLLGSSIWNSTMRLLTWKARVTKQRRLYFQLAVSELPTAGIGCGLLPTLMTQGLKVHTAKGSYPIDPTMLPTPTAIDAGSGRVNRSLSPHASARPTLALAARLCLLPAPMVNDATNASLPRALLKRKSGLAKSAAEYCYQTGVGSRLNPLYVAEMMGFPIDWTISPFLRGADTRSKASETPSSRRYFYKSLNR